MDGVERPLSPHLQVYRWQITNTLSILHRLTGLALSLGLLALTYWLVAAAGSAATHADALALFGAPWFKLPLIVWSFCFFFHLANGIRHLVWDLGFGFERPQIRATGWVVVGAASLATVVFTWFAIL